MSKWMPPVPLRLIPDEDPTGYASHPPGVTGIPNGDRHPGAFGHVRRNHVHEGVDIYCPEGTPVHAVEQGRVVLVQNFTGPMADPPSPWWRNTKAVLVEGESGVVVYGEIEPEDGIEAGRLVRAGDRIGHVVRVLTKDKGRPMSMLHLELHRHGTRNTSEWTIEGGRPRSLLDPTPYMYRMNKF